MGARRRYLASTHVVLRQNITHFKDLDMGKRKELSQAEIWDDSALLRSWDDALEEYKVCDFSTGRIY